MDATMPDTALRITSYFRNVLGTSNMVMVNFRGSAVERTGNGRPRREGYTAAGDTEGIESGKLAGEVLDSLLESLDSGKKRKALREGTLPVLLVLRSMRGKADTAPDNQQALLVAPANASLARSDRGALGYPVDWRAKSPWIPRPLLEETAASKEEAGRKEELAIGAYTAYSSFVSASSMRRSKIDALEGRAQWRAYLAYCEELFRAAAPDAEARLNAADAILDKDGYVLVDTQVNASANVADLYHTIAARLDQAPDDATLALYRGLLNVGPRHQELASDATSLRQMLEHCGTMSREYPLARSQKTAVHAYAALSEGQVLAVSGPPGTGKTTLLESIVADTLVRHALNGREAPVIVGTSTNNQAVRNIIDAFGQIEQDEGRSVFRRWLSDIYYAPLEGSNGFRVKYTKDRPLHSLGAYSPSVSKKIEAQGGNYLICDVLYRDKTLYGYALDKRFKEQSEEVYVEEARAYFGRGFGTAADIQEECRHMLGKIDVQRRKLIETVAQGNTAGAREHAGWLTGHGALDRRGQGIGEKALHDLGSLDDVLDSCIRPLEFWLAMHYYEGVWITCHKQRSPRPGVRTPQPEYDRKSKTKASVETYRHQLAALMPLSVITLFRLPRQFACEDGKGQETHCLNSIDLLIVDEAGQVDTTIGAAAFALAKRAVVVGDTAQLPPVWSLDESVDRQIAEGRMALGSAEFEKVWDIMRERGLSASAYSSLMRAAQAACPWCHAVEGDGERHLDGGLFLREHRRCLDEIISYCNDLLYMGQLLPMRGGIEKRAVSLDLPAMGFCPVEGKAQPSGTSRKNFAEAGAVARWISANLPGIYDSYAESARSKDKEAPDPATLVGVVTPFAAQMREISKALGRQKRELALRSMGPRGLRSTWISLPLGRRIDSRAQSAPLSSSRLSMMQAPVPRLSRTTPTSCTLPYRARRTALSSLGVSICWHSSMVTACWGFSARTASTIR